MASSTQEPGFAKYMKAETIAITIDTADNKTTFNVSINLIRAKSPYLAREIDKAREASRRTESPLFMSEHDTNDKNLEIHLSSIKLAPFEQFLRWIYNLDLNEAVSNPALLVSTYLLAHKFESILMRNRILDTLCHHHANNPLALVGIPAMVKLADAMSPEIGRNATKNMLLKFMVYMLTYRIFTTNWHTYRANKSLHTLFSTFSTCTYWHLDALHEMQKAACPVTAFVDVNVKIDPDAEDNDDEVTLTESPRKRVKRGKGGWVPNPAIRGLESCAYHEDTKGEADGARCALAKAVVVLDD